MGSLRVLDWEVPQCGMTQSLSQANLTVPTRHSQVSRQRVSVYVGAAEWIILKRILEELVCERWVSAWPKHFETGKEYE